MCHGIAQWYRDYSVAGPLQKRSLLNLFLPPNHSLHIGGRTRSPSPPLNRAMMDPSPTTALPLFWVDAFALRVGTGNPAAVVLLSAWPDDTVMQSIAFENGLAETAFVVNLGSPQRYHIKWFTPELEVDLCGHATLAAAFVVLTRLHPDSASVTFDSRSGPLCVTRAADPTPGGTSTPSTWLTMDFPSRPPTPVAPSDVHPHLFSGLRISAASPLYVGRARDYLIELPTPADVLAVTPDFAVLASVDALCVIVTACGPGMSSRDGGGTGAPHVVSRVFCPSCGVPEDPVTGSAHSTIAPYYAAHPKYTAAAEATAPGVMFARQASARGGDLLLRLVKAPGGAAGAERVLITGSAVLYMKGEVYV